MLSILQREIPMLFGLCGDRVANRPTCTAECEDSVKLRRTANERRCCRLSQNLHLLLVERRRDLGRKSMLGISGLCHSMSLAPLGVVVEMKHKEHPDMTELL